MTCPSVQVVSVLSRRDDILRSSVLDVLAKALRSYGGTTPCGPYVPDIQPQNLPRHVEETKPDIVVLVSDYNDLLYRGGNPHKQQQFRDLFLVVSRLESTKMIFAVTSDTSYKEGDLSSTTVEQRAQEMSHGNLNHYKTIILSWADMPSQVHHDVLVNLMCSCKPKPRQDKAPSVPQCRDAEKGLLRYSAVIKDGFILAVQHSDPFYWKPDDGLMEDVLKKNRRRRSTIELWEGSTGQIIPSMKTGEATLRKLIDVGTTEHRHSLQVYGYHNDESTFEEIHTFLKGLGFKSRSSKTLITQHAMFQNIALKSPDYVAVSIDLEGWEDSSKSDVEDLKRKYWQHVMPIIDNQEGMVIMVTGDQSNRKGEHLVSPELRDRFDTLTASLGLRFFHKVTIMSWEHRPFIIHQKIMNKLLTRAMP